MVYADDLTGIVSIGGTRRAMIYTRGTDGVLDDFSSYARFTLDGIWRIAEDFYALGGRHFIAPILWVEAFTSRGARYGEMVGVYLDWLIGEEAVSRYRTLGADPVFLGLYVWLSLVPDAPERSIAEKLAAFQQAWPHDPGRRTIVWEIGGVPACDLTQLDQFVPETAVTSSAVMADESYRQAAQTLYAGHPVGYPRFYIGSHLSDRIAIRSPLSLALSAAKHCQFYFTPYPVLLMPRETLKVIIEDALSSPLMDEFDYRDRLTPEQIAQEAAMIKERIDDPFVVWGLKKPAGAL